MTFKGSLTELSLADLIQLMGVSGKTGVLHLTIGSHRGDIHLVDGQIVDGQFGHVGGEEAVYALAMATRGQFEFEPGPAAERRTVSKSNNTLLLEAARRLDEWRLVSREIPSIDAIPEFVPRPAQNRQITLSPAEWRVLSKVDGCRSVRGVAAAARLSTLDTAKILRGLVSAQLVRVKNGSSGAGNGAAHEPPAELAARVAITRPASLERALGRLARVQDACDHALGSSGQGLVRQHCDTARSEIERGGGPGVIWQAVDQIVRVAAVTRGRGVTDPLLEQLATLD
jgi:hypothetical protein